MQLEWRFQGGGDSLRGSRQRMAMVRFQRRRVMQESTMPCHWQCPSPVLLVEIPPVPVLPVSSDWNYIIFILDPALQEEASLVPQPGSSWRTLRVHLFSVPSAQKQSFHEGHYFLNWNLEIGCPISSAAINLDMCSYSHSLRNQGLSTQGHLSRTWLSV